MENNEDSYKSLIGKDKKEIIQVLGDEFNAPFEPVWSYRLPCRFLQRQKLLLYFDKHQKVIEVKIERRFGWCL